ISPRNARPYAHELEFQVSVRHDRYGTRQQREASSIAVDGPDGPFPPVTYATNKVRSTDYTLGLRWAPSPDIALRASFGTGLLPPTVSQIVSSVVEDVTFNLGNDPKRGGTPMAVPGVPWDYIYSGNPGLRPEQSESWSAGAIFTPHGLEGL